MKLYEEIKEYLIIGKYEYELKDGVPEEIKEKFKRFQKMASCEIIEDKDNKSTQ